MSKYTVIRGAFALSVFCAPGLALAQQSTFGGAAAGTVTGAIVGGPVGAVVGGVAGGALGTAVEPRARTGYYGRSVVMIDPVMQRKWEACSRLYPTFNPHNGTFIGDDGLIHICQ